VSFAEGQPKEFRFKLGDVSKGGGVMGLVDLLCEQNTWRQRTVM
jgi:hypothetical protein